MQILADLGSVDIQFIAEDGSQPELEVTPARLQESRGLANELQRSVDRIRELF